MTNKVCTLLQTTLNDKAWGKTTNDHSKVASLNMISPIIKKLKGIQPKIILNQMCCSHKEAIFRNLRTRIIRSIHEEMITIEKS